MTNLHFVGLKFKLTKLQNRSEYLDFTSQEKCILENICDNQCKAKKTYVGKIHDRNNKLFAD